jgi:osmotically-inducible protein OsmY
VQVLRERGQARTFGVPAPRQEPRGGPVGAAQAPDASRSQHRFSGERGGRVTLEKPQARLGFLLLAGTLDALIASMQHLDTVIEREVWDKLRAHPTVHAKHLVVKVDAGIVTVSGTVANPSESIAAEQAVLGVRGVIEVINGLNVAVAGGAARSDTEVAHAVRHALVWDVFVPDDVISSSVSDGVVRLHGTVDDPTERDEAERAVKNIPGVRSVHNLIDVHPSTETARDVMRAIDVALIREADAEARAIRVQCHEGRVTLSGDVRSAAERQIAVEAAKTAPGVRGVEDHLRVAEP